MADSASGPDSTNSRSTPATHITGVVLAAGPSSRFAGDTPKQLLKIQGEAMVRRVARSALASRLRQILVVVGHEAERVGSSLAGLAVEVVENHDYRQGQSTSVRAGLGRIESDTQAVLFVPCDQPHVTPELIDELIECFEETGGPIVVPTFQGRRGAPVLIGKTLFDDLSTIQGDEGARQLFASHQGSIVEHPIEDEQLLRDIDQLEDLKPLGLSVE